MTDTYKLGDLTVVAEADILDATHPINTRASSQYNDQTGIGKVPGKLYIKESLSGEFTLVTPVDRDPDGEWKDISMSSTDLFLDIALGKKAGYSSVLKFGHNSDIATATDPETIWDVGGIWVPPTAARVHNIASTSAQDAGTVVSTGTTTSASTTTLIDTGATFSTDGVAVNDVVLDDTGGDHSYVLSIDSETQLTIAELHHNGSIASGSSYRVVTPSRDRLFCDSH